MAFRFPHSVSLVWSSSTFFFFFILVLVLKRQSVTLAGVRLCITRTTTTQQKDTRHCPLPFVCSLTIPIARCRVPLPGAVSVELGERRDIASVDCGRNTPSSSRSTSSETGQNLTARKRPPKTSHVFKTYRRQRAVYLFLLYFYFLFLPYFLNIFLSRNPEFVIAKTKQKSFWPP